MGEDEQSWAEIQTTRIYCGCCGSTNLTSDHIHPRPVAEQKDLGGKDYEPNGLSELRLSLGSGIRWANSVAARRVDGASNLDG